MFSVYPSLVESSGNGAFIRKYSISLYLRFTLSLAPFNPQQDSSISQRLFPTPFPNNFPVSLTSLSLSPFFFAFPFLHHLSHFNYLTLAPSLLHPTATRTFDDAQLFFNPFFFRVRFQLAFQFTAHSVSTFILSHNFCKKQIRLFLA